MTLNEAKAAHAAAIELYQTAAETTAGLRVARDEAALAFARNPGDRKIAQSFEAARQAIEHASAHEAAFASLVSERAAAVAEAHRDEAKSAAESAAKARAADVDRAGRLLAEATALEQSARGKRAELAVIIDARVAAMPMSSSMTDRAAERESFTNDVRAAAGQPRLDWLGHEVDLLGRRVAA